MAWTKSPRGSLAMHEQRFLDTANDMLFDLARVVGHIVQKLQSGFRLNLGESLPRQMRQNLTIGQGAVDAGPHGAEVFLAEWRMDRGTGQLTIRKFEALCRRTLHHPAEEVCADLMSQPTRAAVNAQDHV